MRLVKMIREIKGLNSWKMAKKLERSIQSYLALERRTERIAIADLIKLRKIYGGPLDLFWNLLEACCDHKKTKT